jgi:hypothetical protein
MAPVITTNPDATARRTARLAEYMSNAVLDDEKAFRCSSFRRCQESAETKPGVKFFEGQLSHVGLHYDATVDGAPFRVLVVPLDAGHERSRVSLIERREEQVRVRIGESWGDHNQHMKGVVLALRLAFGGSAGTDSEGEWLKTAGGPVHVFDAFAMANLTLCSAIVPRGKGRRSGAPSKTTATMRRNCLVHLGSTISILQPTLVIGQGAPVRDTLREEFDFNRRLAELVWIASIGGARFVWVPLKHPSRNWFFLSSPYLHDAVIPSISLGREVALSRELIAND